VARRVVAALPSDEHAGAAAREAARGPGAGGLLTAGEIAENALRRFLEQKGAKLTAAGGVKFGTVADEYIANLEARIEAGDFRASTLRSYRNIVNRDLRPEWGERPIDTITREEVAAYRTRLAKRGLAAGTMNQHRAIVRGMFALAVRNYGLEGSPAVGFQWTRSRRATSGAISFYRPGEVQRLAEHAGSEQDAAIFVTAAFTGLRASELRNLRWRSVDFADSLVHVERGYTDEGGEQLPKSYKVRSVPLMPQVAAVLSALRRRDYFATEDDLVFVNLVGKWIDRSALYLVGKWIDRSALHRRYEAAQRAAGLRELRFHDLRHSFGTMAVRAFPITDVQTWMGHADIATTSEVRPLRDAAGRGKAPRRSRGRAARRCRADRPAA